MFYDFWGVRGPPGGILEKGPEKDHKKNITSLIPPRVKPFWYFFVGKCVHQFLCFFAWVLQGSKSAFGADGAPIWCD